MTDESCCSGAGGDAVAPSAQRTAVRERYGDIASPDSESGVSEEECCESSESNMASCGSGNAAALAERLGYSQEELEQVVEGANLGLGCGNPTAIANLSSGETVLDLGAGGGFDCFLAGAAVGPEGQVIGVDMTPEMVERARENAQKNDATNVEFRLGEIEHLPVADETVDVIISNCVINLSPAKAQVFEEAYRVLRPGGRLAITDVVFTASPPTELRDDVESLVSCVGGAATRDELESHVAAAGFESISIEPKDESDEIIREWSTEYPLEEYLVSVRLTATKPEA